MSEEGPDDIHNELGIRKYPKAVPVETKKVETGIKPTELVLEVDLPGDTAVEAIVKQDITGNGNPDNQQQINAQGGKHSYELTEFELNGYQVWTELILKSNDGVNNPSVSSYSLSGDKLKNE